MFPLVMQFLGLLLAGILAGMELLVRYGIHPALESLEDRAHILARMALVRRLRILVPAIMLPTVAVAIVVLVVGGTGDGFVFRWLGMASLLALLAFSFLGTVPINIRINDTWNADSPPDDWKAVVRRWQIIDVFRSTSALLAFVFFLVAIAVEMSLG